MSTKTVTIYPSTYEWYITQEGTISEHGYLIFSEDEPDGNNVAVGPPITLEVAVWDTDEMLEGKLACLELAREALRKESLRQLEALDTRIAELKCLPAPKVQA